MGDKDQFSAAASAAGYFYQARLALAESLKFAYDDASVEIAIERFDDVSFERNGTPLELLQTKHHLRKAGDLSDASPDIWRTLRVWAERVKKDPSLPSRVRFALITTAQAPADSAAFLLKPRAEPQPDQVLVALEKLRAVAANSKNKSLMPAFAAFTSLAPPMQQSLLSAVEVLDSSPLLVDLEQAIEDRLRMIAPRGKAKAARELLEGWWWGRIAKSLQDPSAATVSILELETRLDDIREYLKRDALPVDMEDAVPDEEEMEALNEMAFVRQLRMVRLGDPRIELAKRDFYRASTQRSRWTRESLLFDGEVAKFERTLIEEWEPRYHGMCDELAAKTEAEKICQAGQKLYQWVEAEARFQFRSVTHRFLTVGSYNMLANDLRVGWHRDFSKILTKPLEK